MKHLGDITKINGAEAPVVDCVIGGSPCQDLSTAGKRAGLAGERSGLYMEQLRVIKEMRHKDELCGRTGEFIRPRYMVWENVPGAFSCNKGEDFGAVLTEAVRVIEPEAPDVPVPEKGWPTAGVLLGDEWSIAWRVLDAQYWGVPQRRRRISLVCDFGGHTAPEILFVSNSLSGHPEKSRAERERTAGDSETGTAIPINDKATRWSGGGKTRNHDGSGNGLGVGKNGDPAPTLSCGDRHAVCYNGSNITSPINKTNPNPGDPCHTLTDDSRNYVIQPIPIMDSVGGQAEYGKITDKCPTLKATHYKCPPVVAGFSYLQGAKAAGVSYHEEQAPTLKAGNFDAAVLPENHPADSRVTLEESGICQTLTSRMGTGGGNVPMVMSVGNGQANQSMGETAATLNCMHDQQAIMVASVDARNMRETEVNSTLQAKPNGGQNLNSGYTVRTGMAVRRLTPMECERLQGFPDGWTDIGEWVDSKGKKHKPADSPRYKALGNSIALPPWRWVLKRLCAQYERTATMASLFDGIGGFPLIWEGINGKGTCLWASEIEEFPMAVTKIRFGGNK